MSEQELSFLKVTPAVIPSLAPFFEGKRAGICDMTAVYLHMWGALLGTEYALFRDVLFLRRNTRHGVFYYPPLVKGEDPDFARGLAALSLIVGEGGISLGAVPERWLEAVRGEYAVCDVATSRNYADYVYRAEDLATLGGKKYSKKSKKNHIKC